MAYNDADRYFDRQGKPIKDVLTWGKMFEDKTYQILKQDRFRDDVLVSTVWLGANHNFSREGPPLIFETMIFGGTLSEEQWRYATEAEALAGHEAACQMVRDSFLSPTETDDEGNPI